DGHLAVTNESALNASFRDARAITPEDRGPRPPRLGMNCSRHQLFAGSRLAGDQNPAVRRRHYGNLLSQSPHGHRLADHLVLLAQLGSHLSIRALELPLTQCVADRQHRLLDRKRLFNEIERAELGSAHGGLDIAMT